MIAMGKGRLLPSGRGARATIIMMPAWSALSPRLHFERRSLELVGGSVEASVTVWISPKTCH